MSKSTKTVNKETEAVVSSTVAKVANADATPLFVPREIKIANELVARAWGWQR